MRIIGPNCLGVMSPVTGLNATFAAGDGAARQRRLHQPERRAAAPRSSTGACARTSASARFVSIGSMLDVGWGDLIDYLGDDPHTARIVIYMESIGDARAFLSAAREVALTKPIIVIKAGRTRGGQQAAASHTGSLTGSRRRARRRVPAQRRAARRHASPSCSTWPRCSAKQPRPTGPRLTIVTNAGGPGVLATDALIAGGGELAELAPRRWTRSNAVLPAAWSHNNPIDILGDATPERYAKALAIAAADPEQRRPAGDPDAAGDDRSDAHGRGAGQARARSSGKPVLASWMGGADVAAGDGHPRIGPASRPSPFPDDAARTFCYMWRYADNLRALYETPERCRRFRRRRPPDEARRDHRRRARREGRTLLDRGRVEAVLAAYGIPTVTTRVARDEAEAVAAARDDGLSRSSVKLWSRTITHKTDVGGVQARTWRTRPRVRDARIGEIRASVVGEGRGGAFPGRDRAADGRSARRLRADPRQLASIPQFGPVLLFGTGGRAGRGASRPRAGAAAAQHDAGAPD